MGGLNAYAPRLSFEAVGCAACCSMQATRASGSDRPVLRLRKSDSKDASKLLTVHVIKLELVLSMHNQSFKRRLRWYFLAATYARQCEENAP